MSRFSAIDLSKLPAPDVVENVEYQEIIDEMRRHLVELAPELSDGIESDPVQKILEIAAYRETLLRQRINQAARAVMLPYARGADLDNLASLYGVARQIVTPADPEATPPVPETRETDDRLRHRVQLSLEAHSTAGPRGAYQFHAVSASADVKDATVSSPSPGHVLVTVLSATGDGTADADLVNQVDNHLNDEDVRPLTDLVSTQGAEIVPYEVTAQLTVYAGPDGETVRNAAAQACQNYADENHRLGRDITPSGLYAALHQAGAHEVIITAPAQKIVVTDTQAAYCQAVTVNLVGVDE